jgi:ribonuclease HI
MDEKVGCAWVLLRKEDQIPCFQQTIRLSSDTSVFRSESIALLEASVFATKLPGSTIIFTDSKSNLEALENASLTNPEIAQLFNILQVNERITIQWIPGHSGIPGNDIVDQIAKWSAASPVLPIITPAKTAEAYIQDVVQQIAKNWKLKFENSAPSPPPSHRYVTTKLPTQFHIARLYDSTRPPAQNTTLTRLRTGTFNLNHYLHKINRADTPKCKCGFNNETIAHFLLRCPMHRAQRRVLRNNITRIAGRSASPLNLDVLLDQPKCTPSTLAFVDAVMLARSAV